MRATQVAVHYELAALPDKDRRHRGRRSRSSSIADNDPGGDNADDDDAEGTEDEPDRDADDAGLVARRGGAMRAVAKRSRRPLLGAATGPGAGSAVCDPKVLFANERTFLGWLGVCTSLGAIGTSLLTFFAHDAVAIALGCTMWALALSFMGYAAIMFRRRAASLRDMEPSSGPSSLLPLFDDRRGPVTFTVLLVIAVLAYVIYFIVEQPAALLPRP